MPAPDVGAITVFVADLAASKEWYERVFDCTVVFEDAQSAVVQFENTMVNLLLRSEAPDLVAPAAVAAPGAGAAVMFTVFVADADASIAALAQRGVPPLNGPIDRPWGMRTLCIADPDGTIWELAQPLEA